MIDYGQSSIRESALSQLCQIGAEPDRLIRYPYIIGVIGALLSKDPEMAKAIRVAFDGPLAKAGR